MRSLMNSPPYVLVVDDDRQIVRMIKMALEMDGFEVLIVTSGKAALDAVRRRRPDLLISPVPADSTFSAGIGLLTDASQPVARGVWMS